jgi:hypothetical protein
MSAVRSLSGEKGRDQGECGAAKHGPDAELLRADETFEPFRGCAGVLISGRVLLEPLKQTVTVGRRGRCRLGRQWEMSSAGHASHGTEALEPQAIISGLPLDEITSNV